MKKEKKKRSTEENVEKLEPLCYILIGHFCWHIRHSAVDIARLVLVSESSCCRIHTHFLSLHGHFVYKLVGAIVGVACDLGIFI